MGKNPTDDEIEDIKKEIKTDKELVKYQKMTKFNQKRTSNNLNKSKSIQV